MQMNQAPLCKNKEGKKRKLVDNQTNMYNVHYKSSFATKIVCSSVCVYDYGLLNLCEIRLRVQFVYGKVSFIF